MSMTTGSRDNTDLDLGVFSVIFLPAGLLKSIRRELVNNEPLLFAMWSMSLLSQLESLFWDLSQCLVVHPKNIHDIVVVG